MDINNCSLCPRKCGADRNITEGFCGGGNSVKVARAALHFWEEPCLSGANGSGTVFFSGCSLKCCFCQNYKISAENFGREISSKRLAEIFLELQENDAHNINLVNPTHYIPWIIEALDIAKPKLKLPIVYNCGGYESVESLKMLEGYVDIYLPDLKYFNDDLSKKYSKADGYFDTATKAILEMFRQVGEPLYDGEILKRGLIIRHLALPSHRDDSIKILEWIARNFKSDEIIFSLMSQYTPFFKSKDFAEINRRISTFEYNKIISEAVSLGLEGYMQEKSSAKEEYTPAFDLTGI